jgi:hypothetical protein
MIYPQINPPLQVLPSDSQFDPKDPIMSMERTVRGLIDICFAFFSIWIVVATIAGMRINLIAKSWPSGSGQRKLAAP